MFVLHFCPQGAILDECVDLCSVATRDAVCVGACVKPETPGSVWILAGAEWGAEDRVGQARKTRVDCFLERSVNS